ncbi:MAG: hypothetical protein L6R37_003559 [Teloschistes peruensis]|nr:MAG: hypothetical protein L6R37_003559 [Teloschistes peruensis]
MTTSSAALDLVQSISRDNEVQHENRARIRSTTDTDISGAYLERQIFRRFRAGDIYAPHDLSSAEQHKWRRRPPSASINTPSSTSTHSGAKKRDVFDALGIHPLDEFKNPSIMAEYVSAMGRLRHRRETGLRGVNQRRISKAVRRAVGMGFLPSVHRHPEILEEEAARAWEKKATVGAGGFKYSRAPNRRVER